MLLQSHINHRARLIGLIGLFLLLLLTVRAAEPLPRELQGVKVEEHLGKTIPLNLEFTNDKGEHAQLDKYFHHGRPVVLQLVYYRCPMLCTLVQDGFMDGMKKMNWTPGKEFDVLTISIDPKEKPELAAIKKQNYISKYGRPEAAAGWHWFASEDNQVKQLAEAVGFHYRWDERQKQYAHEAAVFVLTSEGKISRYLYGISYKPKDLRLALLEASEGRVGTTLDRLILFCYHYDPQGKRYALAATRLMQAGGAATVLVLGSVIGFYLWSERRRSRLNELILAQPAETAGSPGTHAAGPAHG